MNIIVKLHEVLNLLKDFRAAYSTKNMDQGLMLVEYKDRRYAVKVVDITDPNVDVIKAIDNLEYMV